MMILNAPAKINIGLRILNKREDGFHNIETIFYPVKLFDAINIHINKSATDTNSIIVKTEKQTVPLSRNNTCFKAVEAVFKAFRIRETYKIEILLNKHIPVGGGLGGGSSDAGTIIRYLLKYFNINLAENRDKVMNAALEVGSDVPFFLIQKPCYATGKGEKLHLLNNFILDYDILLVNPNQHISTKWAYENLGFKEGDSFPPVLSGVSAFKPEDKELFRNDFEKVVFKKYPLLQITKESLLNKGAVFSSMSGSGAVIYGFFNKTDKDKLFSARNEFKEAGNFAAIVS
ncbi:MAG: 4-(cytidine 5'-diphospho)-2-C-methyl-D-erythritol kinase [Ignavibacteria bacterium]